MFDIRKIQENIIYEAVRAESNEDIANEVVYGKDNMSKAENNSDWVKSSMIRLENNFETETIKKIRMNCQCGYEMDEKIARAETPAIILIADFFIINSSLFSVNCILLQHEPYENNVHRFKCISFHSFIILELS